MHPILSAITAPKVTHRPDHATPTGKGEVAAREGLQTAEFAAFVAQVSDREAPALQQADVPSEQIKLPGTADKETPDAAELDSEVSPPARSETDGSLGTGKPTVDSTGDGPSIQADRLPASTRETSASPTEPRLTPANQPIEKTVFPAAVVLKSKPLYFVASSALPKSNETTLVLGQPAIPQSSGRALLPKSYEGQDRPAPNAAAPEPFPPSKQIGQASAHNAKLAISKLIPASIGAPLTRASREPEAARRAGEVKAPAPSVAQPHLYAVSWQTGVQVAPPGHARGTSGLVADTKHDRVLPTSSGLEMETVGLSRSELSGSTSTGSTSSIPMRMDMPISVSRQIADALQNMPGRPVEIRLSPEELGRVRLAVSSSEAGITVNVLAERPETMDLLRRNIADLESAFQDLGYEDIAFSFSDTGNQADRFENDNLPGPFSDVQEADASENTPSTHIVLAPSTNGIDIRL